MNIELIVLDILGRSQVNGAILRLPEGQLDRKVYEAVNRVITVAGGKWNKKSKGHVFEYDAADVIDGILLTGEVQNVRQDFGQFDSPPAVVSRVIALAEIAPRMTLLEPSAGIGNIALAAAAAGAEVMCFEIDERRCETLVKASAKASHRLDMVVQQDFLTEDPCPLYDRVVMNPPFARQADIAHVMHAVRFLKPGGRLVSVMSPTWQTRGTKIAQEFRAFLTKLKAVVVDLPSESFKESGTCVNAVIVSFEV